MIVDVHTHTPRFRDRIPEEYRARQFNDRWNPGASRPVVYTWDDYRAAMTSVDRTICFNIAQAPPGQRQVDEPYIVTAPRVNDETAAFVATDPSKFIGFLSVHPDDPGAIDEIERGVSNLGLRGIKLGLNYQNVHPLGDNARRIYAEAEARGLPILFHQGTSPVRFATTDYSHPRHMDEIAIAHPDLTIVMAHIGHPFYLDCLMTARKHPHVWVDVSGAVLRAWGLYNAMVAAQEWGVLDRLLFASDYPASTPDETMRLLRDVNAAAPGPDAPRIADRAIEDLIVRDSLGLLGLD